MEHILSFVKYLRLNLTLKGDYPITVAVLKKQLRFLWWYIKSWLWHVLLVLVVITLSVTAITFVGASSKATTSDSKLTKKFYQKLYLVQVQAGSNDSQKQEILNVIKSLDSVDFVMAGSLAFFNTPSVVATMRRPIVFLDSADYTKFLQVFNLELKSGSLPLKGSNQLAFNTQSLQNRKLQIGSEIGKQVSKDDPFLPGKYEVTGELKFNQETNSFFMGLGNFDSTKGGEISYFIKPISGREDSLNQELLKLEQKYNGVAVETDQTYSKYAEKEVQGADFINNSITGVVTLSATISVVLLILLFINSRINEIAMFLALGYSYGFVYFKVFLEILFKIILSWFFGLVFAQMLFNYLNMLIFQPKAIHPLSVLEPEVLLNSSILPIVLIISALVAVVIKINRVSLIILVNRD